jgi:hypothetical protein
MGVNNGTDRHRALVAVIALVVALDLWAVLGPRSCPACLAPRTISDRLRGAHACQWDGPQP